MNKALDLKWEKFNCIKTISAGDGECEVTHCLNSNTQTFFVNTENWYGDGDTWGNGAGKTMLLALAVTIDGSLVTQSAFGMTKSFPRQCTVRWSSSVRGFDLQSIGDCTAERDSWAKEVADWFEKLNLIATYDKQSQERQKGQRYNEIIGLFVVRPLGGYLTSLFPMD